MTSFVFLPIDESHETTTRGNLPRGPPQARRVVHKLFPARSPFRADYASLRVEMPFRTVGYQTPASTPFRVPVTRSCRTSPRHNDGCYDNSFRRYHGHSTRELALP